MEGYNGFPRRKCRFAALAASFNHPIAKSITNKYLQWGHENVGDLIMDYQEISDMVSGGGGDRIVLAENRPSIGGRTPVYGGSGMLYTAVDGIFAGYISISDEIKGSLRRWRA